MVATREQWRQYQVEKQQYEADLIRYKSDLEEWNKLSPQEKSRRHKSAEKFSRKFWSFLAAAVVSCYLYFYFRQSFSGDTFWLVWGGASVGTLTIALLVSSILGILVRAAFFSVLSVLAAAMFFYVLGKFVDSPPSEDLAKWITIGVAVIVFLLGLTKAFHAGAAPSQPVPPTQPT